MPAVTGARPLESETRLRQPSGIRLVDDVAGSIEDAILAGRMRPGERLVETSLCAELSVSRTTLREALLALRQRGLVRIEPRRGTFVTRLSREHSVDLCRARALLESDAVYAGYDRLGAEQFAQLQVIVDEMAGCVLPDDLPRLIRLDLAFHTVLVDAGNSPSIRDLWRSLNGKMSALILSSIEHHHAQVRDVGAFHQALLDAVRASDAANARDAVIAHYVGVDREGVSSLAEIASVIESMTRHA